MHLQLDRTIMTFSLIHGLVWLYKRNWKDGEVLKSRVCTMKGKVLRSTNKRKHINLRKMLFWFCGT